MIEAIVRYKRVEVAARRARRPEVEVAAAARMVHSSRSFHAALAAPGLSLIAEVKQKSPSRGELRPDFDALALARAYVAGGACAVSVLADREFFGGGTEVVAAVAADPAICVPVMWKDFVIDTYQVLEARAAGADAILLIARAAGGTLAELLDAARGVGLAAVVETFTAEEVEEAVAAGAAIIGINNRDLGTFVVDQRRAARLRGLLPPGVLSVSESGLNCRADFIEAERDGFDAVLVGEALVTAADPAARARELIGAA